MFKLTSALALGFTSVVLTASAATPDLPSCDVWMAACHWTNASRESSHNIDMVVCHKTQGGTAAGAASWFANCSSGGSAHFSFDKSNGYCYQSVYEADIAWHAGYGSTNNRSVGIEHSGWVANNDTSTACYNESAIETKSCGTYYAVPMNRTYVIGHSQVPGCSGYGGGTSCHTDPGPHWNWTTYMNAVANAGGTPPPPPPPLPTYTLDNTSGGFSVVGTWATGSSAADKYGADYRYKSTGPTSEPASWAAGVTSGTYRVQAWWAAGANRSATAPYILPNGATVNKNQQTGGGVWNTLGTIGLSGTATTKLSIWTTAGYIVVADAVRYTP